MGDESNEHLFSKGRLELPYNIVGEPSLVEKPSLYISGLSFAGQRSCSIAKDNNLISEALFSRLHLTQLPRIFDLTECTDPSTAQKVFLHREFCILQAWNDLPSDNARSHHLK